MSSDCRSTCYSRFDWTPSFVEDDYDSRSTSSTLSWNDETDKDAATKLKEHFERFEAALYSETNGDDLTDSERAECNIWKERFPHLRVLGKQIVLKPSPDKTLESLWYPSDYEEVIASHSSEADAGQEINDEVVDKLCERVLPTVLKKIEEFSARKLISTKNELEVNGTKYPEKKTHSPTDFRSSYLKVDDLKRVPSRKLESLPSAPKFPTIIIDHPKTTKKLDRVHKSARSKKKPLNEYESETMIDKMATPPKSDRHGLLPPIEALAITPNFASKRANSAMLRFSRTVPRVRPFTTRNKTMYLMPVKNGFVNDIQNKINPLIDEKSYASSLPPYSGYNRKSKLPPRWRY